MKYKRFGSKILVRIDKDEEILLDMKVSCIFSMLTFPVLFRTLETVPWDTPASLAISLMVGTGSSPFLQTVFSMIIS